MNTDKNESRKTLEVGCPGLCPVGLNYLTKTLKGMGINVVKVNYPEKGGVEIVFEGNLSNLEDTLKKMGYRVYVKGIDACCPECATPENTSKKQTLILSGAFISSILAFFASTCCIWISLLASFGLSLPFLSSFEKLEPLKPLFFGFGFVLVTYSFLKIYSTHFYSRMHRMNKILLWSSLFILMAGLFISLGDL